MILVPVTIILLFLFLGLHDFYLEREENKIRHLYQVSYEE